MMIFPGFTNPRPPVHINLPLFFLGTDIISRSMRTHCRMTVRTLVLSHTGTGRLTGNCLSRGFRSGAEMKELGKLVQPEVVKNIMSEDNFETFAHRIEHNAHRFVSQSIRGELSKFTGPYDPVFFLHHTNLDRLWWSWQMMDPKHRVQAYDGKSNRDTLRRASLEDTLDMGGLRRNLPVGEVMEITSGVFCYRY
ncbi:hypothetical protein OCU04_008189 [Sclerotinia nivalis]|uniref:Tyrosinase copper-binding domain-containing protein n=1 Tax=Sclerotinia nivalis TaxID=352851 RepID=A0A9X0DIJ8_9HELO|nr:hypothetical protein OCU04_008189 [Sclerotinia nivalis]